MKSSDTGVVHVPVMASWCNPRYAARAASDVFAAVAFFVATFANAASDPASSAAVADAITHRLSSRLWTYEPTHVFSLTGQLSAYGRNEP